MPGVSETKRDSTADKAEGDRGLKEGKNDSTKKIHNQTDAQRWEECGGRDKKKKTRAYATHALSRNFKP